MAATLLPSGPPDNPTLALVLRHAGWGALMGLVFAIALVAFDAHGIGRLMAGSESGWVAFVLLAGGFMISFGSLVAGTAIMSLSERDKGDDDDDGLRASAVLVPAVIRLGPSHPNRRPDL